MNFPLLSCLTSFGYVHLLYKEHPQGLEMDKSDKGDWAWAFGWAATVIPSTASFGPFILLFFSDTMLVLIPLLSSSAVCSCFVMSLLLFFTNRLMGG